MEAPKYLYRLRMVDTGRKVFFQDFRIAAKLDELFYAWMILYMDNLESVYLHSLKGFGFGLVFGLALILSGYP